MAFCALSLLMALAACVASVLDVDLDCQRAFAEALGEAAPELGRLHASRDVVRNVFLGWLVFEIVLRTPGVSGLCS